MKKLIEEFKTKQIKRYLDFHRVESKEIERHVHVARIVLNESTRVAYACYAINGDVASITMFGTLDQKMCPSKDLFKLLLIHITSQFPKVKRIIAVCGTQNHRMVKILNSLKFQVVTHVDSGEGRTDLIFKLSEENEQTDDRKIFNLFVDKVEKEMGEC